ncbi:hypothetical protein IF2G_07692 [Cordyceps javanica]|nr:hypothetical protein IF2G_07692 [Cordyceps javanica]
MTLPPRIHCAAANAIGDGPRMFQLLRDHLSRPPFPVSEVRHALVGGPPPLANRRGPHSRSLVGRDIMHVTCRANIR